MRRTVVITKASAGIVRATAQTHAGDPDAIQRRIRRARAGLLGGRGPGAAPDEISRWQRDRPMLGGRPTAAERQEVADQAILARGDLDALGHLIVRRRAMLAGSLDALAGRLRYWHARSGDALRLAGAAALASGAAAVIMAVTAARRGRQSSPAMAGRDGLQPWPRARR